MIDVRHARGHLEFTADEPAVALLSQALIESGVLIAELAPQTVTLEDLFFSLTEGDGTLAAPTGDGADRAAGELVGPE